MNERTPLPGYSFDLRDEIKAGPPISKREALHRRLFGVYVGFPKSKEARKAEAKVQLFVPSAEAISRSGITRALTQTYLPKTSEFPILEDES